MNHPNHLRCAALLCILSLIVCLFAGCSTPPSDVPTEPPTASTSDKPTSAPVENDDDAQSNETLARTPYPTPDYSSYPLLLASFDQRNIYYDSYLWDIENCTLTYQRRQYICPDKAAEDRHDYPPTGQYPAPQFWDGGTQFLFSSQIDEAELAFSGDIQLIHTTKIFPSAYAVNLFRKTDVEKTALRWVDSLGDNHDYSIADIPLSDEADAAHVLSNYQLLYGAMEDSALHLFFDKQLAEEELPDGSVAAPRDIYYACYLPQSPENTQWKRIPIAAEDSNSFILGIDPYNIYFRDGKLYCGTLENSILVIDTDAESYYFLSDLTDQVIAMFPDCQQATRHQDALPISPAGQWGDYLLVKVPLVDKTSDDVRHSFYLAIRTDTETIAGAMQISSTFDTETWEYRDVFIELYDENLKPQAHLTDFPLALYDIYPDFAKELHQ